LILSPLNTTLPVDFTQEVVQQAIAEAISEYNNASVSSRTNPKMIMLDYVSERQIGIKLLAYNELSSPGRSLRTLSLLLVKDSYFSRLLTKDNKLFTSIHSERDDKAEGFVDVSWVSNSTVLKAIIDAIDHEKNHLPSKQALDEIRKVCQKHHLFDPYME
jgi:hypothetical protein